MDHAQVSARVVAKVVLIAAGVLAALYFAYLIREVIGLVLIAAFFALAIAPAVNWLDRAPRARAGLAILLVYLAIAAAHLRHRPADRAAARQRRQGPLQRPPRLRRRPAQQRDLPRLRRQVPHHREAQRAGRELPSKLGDAAGTLRDVTVDVFSRFVQLFSILVITFFLLMDGTGSSTSSTARCRPSARPRLRKIAGDISDAISGYVFGNFVISVLAGLVTYVTLRILDVPFALPLAILFGFFDLIPLVGATLGGILVGIVVAFVSFPGGLIVWVAVLIVYQQVENNLIQPVVYGKAVQLHPLIVIIAILIGGALLGVLGALLAIPAAAAVQAWCGTCGARREGRAGERGRPPSRRRRRAAPPSRRGTRGRSSSRLGQRSGRG